MSRIPIDSVKKISMEFRNRLLELIDEQEITKAEFAKKAGVSISVINRALIYGIIPSLRPLIKIADYLFPMTRYAISGIPMSHNKIIILRRNYDCGFVGNFQFKTKATYEYRINKHATIIN